MQGLILAAGRGSRLGRRSLDLPKCLLEIGRRPLIEHQLEVLSESGVGPVAMVLGYCADEIREAVGIRAEYILNPRWHTTNSLQSFFLAREWVKGPVLILNSDVLFHPKLLDLLLAVKGDAIAYDSSSGRGREHMKVQVVEGRLLAMSKVLPEEQVAGENVGLVSLSAATAQTLFQKAEGILATGGDKQWLGYAVCELARESSIQAVDVAGLPWGEIDFPYDLDRVRKEVWPAIRPRSRPRRVWGLACRCAALLALCLTLGFLALVIRPPPPVQAWDTLEVEKLQKTKLLIAGRTQDWWILPRAVEVEMEIMGPLPVRIESRVLSLLGDQKVHYVLEVKLDGRRVDWFMESAAPSRVWRHAEGPVTKRGKIDVEVPSGRHSLRLRLVASDVSQCFIRVRQGEDEEVRE